MTVVYQMFVDLALLVNQQGEMLDNIEISLNDSKNYVETGEQELIKAKELHKAARKVNFIFKKMKIDGYWEILIILENVLYRLHFTCGNRDRAGTNIGCSLINNRYF